jgi:hypothetical protein
MFWQIDLVWMFYVLGALAMSFLVIVDGLGVISPFDENDVDPAVRLREEKGEKIMVPSLGKKLSEVF